MMEDPLPSGCPAFSWGIRPGRAGGEEQHRWLEGMALSGGGNRDGGEEARESSGRTNEKTRNRGRR